MCRAEVIFLLRCDPGSGRRVRTTVALKEWVPCHFHHKAQSPTASPTEWGAHGHQWLSTTSMACHNQFIECWVPWPLRSPFGLLDSEAASEKLCPREAEERSCGHTLGRQAGHWIIAWQSTDGLSGTGMCQLQHLLNTCLLLGTRWISQKPRY